MIGNVGADSPLGRSCRWSLSALKRASTMVPPSGNKACAKLRKGGCVASWLLSGAKKSPLVPLYERGRQAKPPFEKGGLGGFSYPCGRLCTSPASGNPRYKAHESPSFLASGLQFSLTASATLLVTPVVSGPFLLQRLRPPGPAKLRRPRATAVQWLPERRPFGPTASGAERPGRDQPAADATPADELTPLCRCPGLSCLDTASP